MAEFCLEGSFVEGRRGRVEDEDVEGTDCCEGDLG